MAWPRPVIVTSGARADITRDELAAAERPGWQDAPHNGRYPATVRLSFRRDPGTEEELRALAVAESQCCSWAAWAVRASAGQIVLDVRAATPEGITPLHSMFTGLR